MANMSSIKFSIPLGYTVTKKVSVLDVDAAVKILSSRKRRKYIQAHRSDYDLFAELRADIWKCPYCNLEYSATLMDNRTHEFCKSPRHEDNISRRLIEKWGTHQLSLFGNECEDLVFAPVPVITGEWTCPKCHRKSNASMGERTVYVEYDGQKVRIRAEICDLGEFLSIPWMSCGTITLQFPIYEVLTFNFNTSHTYIELQSDNRLPVATRDITSQPSVWEKGVIYRLISDNVIISRTIKRIFLEKFGGVLPFEKNELVPNKYILMTRFVGFPRRFYDAIPYARGTYQIEQTFCKVADKLHKTEDALLLFQKSGIPKCKSIKKLFFTNLGLLFYVDECEKLWKVINDINHFRYLMKCENIFDVLALLHQRPLLFGLILDYANIKGVRSMIGMLVNNWVMSIDYAIDYCTMNDAMKEAEHKKWKDYDVKCYRYNENDDYDDDEYDDEYDDPFYFRRHNSIALFSIPMKTPDESIQDCIIDGFSFSWLRCGNDYYMAGEALRNCLIGWHSMNNPVVVVKKNEKIVAAIEVAPRGVLQVQGYRNTNVSRVPGLSEAYQKWLEKYNLKDLLCYTHNDLPF